MTHVLHSRKEAFRELFREWRESETAIRLLDTKGQQIMDLQVGQIHELLATGWLREDDRIIIYAIQKRPVTRWGTR
jgi:hypothetical protein